MGRYLTYLPGKGQRGKRVKNGLKDGEGYEK
jgi:hypothetical protein